MGTFEAYEQFNKRSALVNEPLMPYSGTFEYTYSKEGRRLQNAHSLSKDDDDDDDRVETLHKRRRLDEVSMSIRRLWSDRQPLVMLISSYTLPCLLWSPGTPSSHRTLFRPLTWMPGSPLAVASDRGLVCVRFKRQREHRLDLAVGNPLTGEWVCLPQSDHFWELSGYRYRMEVGEPGHNGYRVDFRVAVSITSTESHRCHVFDSVSGKWSSTTLNYPGRSAFKWSAFDLRSSSWRTELLHGPRPDIRTGLERSPTEVHRLSYPFCHEFCVWEYKGSTYLASPCTVDWAGCWVGMDYSACDFAGYGLWEVSSKGECLNTVAAVWGVEAGASLVAVRLNVWEENLGVKCAARENLVWFSVESEYSPAMGVVVYDLESKQWTVFDEQEVPPMEDPFVDSVPGKHYGSAVAYTPSLVISPSRLDSKRNDVSSG